MATDTTASTPGVDEKNGTPFDCGWPSKEAVEGAARRAKHVADEVRHTAEEITVKTEETVRRHPLAAVGAAVTVGAAFGCLFGLGVGWLARSRR